MNEIKFRAYDEEHKLMVYSDNQPDGYEWEINEHHGVICMYYDYIDDDFGGNVCYGEHLPIMQYTGIKDKNGKEIYEGDILVYKFKSYFSGSNQVAYYIVKYEDGMFCIYVEEFNDNNQKEWVQEDRLCESLIKIDKLEVIGNIYENPELLEEI